MLIRRIAADLEKAPGLVAERGSVLGLPMHLLASTTSTNDEAKHAAKDGAPSGSTWVAEQQTAGRGRQGRAWVSPRGENLLFSVLVRVACPPSRLPPIALVAGLAVRDAVALAAAEATPRIKWPNDVLIDASRAPPDRAVVLADVLACLDRDLHVVVARGLGLLRMRLEAADSLRGSRVRNDTGDEGTASGIDDDGRLLVRRDDGVVTRWSAGEVHLV